MSGRVRTGGRWFLGMVTWGAISLSANCALAQIKPVPDNTLGAESSVVTPSVIKGIPSDRIDGGAIRGKKLFHSFQEFNIDSGRGAYFINPSGIENIFSRVTGGNASKIFGTLGVLGNANLFLINPNGIIFGPSSSLDVRGSFVASTASSLKFADGTEFSAKTPQTTPLLTISVPIGLQFGTNPGSILNQSQATDSSGETVGLQVQSGKTLALVGGDVALQGGYLVAPDGRIELGSVAGNSFVSLTPTNAGYTFGYQGVKDFQDIRLMQGSDVTTSGDSGGSIQVQGANVTLTDGSEIEATTLGVKTGEGLTVNASKSVHVIGESPDGIFPSAFFSRTVGTGRAGDLTINTPVLFVNGAQISTSTNGPGNAGNLTVNASELVQLTGTSKNGDHSGGLYAQARPRSTGNAGSLTINTKQLLVQDGTEVSTTTFGSGNGGSLTVNASKGVQVIDTKGNTLLDTALFTSTLGKGNAGDLTINTPVLLVQNGAKVSVSTLGSGKAGSLTVNASKIVQLAGTNVNGDPSALFAQTTGTGNPGYLTINTPILLIQDGAQATVSGVRVAGDLGINANSVRLDNGKIIAVTLSGNGGNLKLNVADLLLMRRGSEISATAGTQRKGGDGGNIIINAPNGFIVAVPNENSDISANAFSGSGGKVTINATGIYGIAPLTRLDLERLRPGDLDPRQVPTSDITAISQTSPNLNGTVTVNTLGIDPTQGLVNLPVIPVDTKVAQGCYAGGTQAQSEFIIIGRGGLPPNPGEPLSTDAVQVDLVALPNQEAQHESRRATQSESHTTEHPHNSSSGNPPTQIVEAQGWIVDKKGDVELVAFAPTSTPHNPRFNSTSCQLERK